ncbi:MAG: glucan biosynthesis protein [bacterium]|nr:glucan biosynthesis protein [bacterium]
MNVLSKTVFILSINLLILSNLFAIQNNKFDYACEIAKKLSKSPYQPNNFEVSKGANDLSFAKRSEIKFNENYSPWKNTDSFFDIVFYPIAGKLFNKKVSIFEFNGSSLKEFKSTPKYFNFGKSGLPHNKLPKGFSGFRIVHKKKNTDTTSKTGDDIISFQGGCYFRPNPPGTGYGLSLRALSINTVLENIKEEFPDFTDFWIEKPAKESKSFTLYALLNSKSLTGAYEFKITYEKIMKIKIRSTLYFRHQVKQIGLAPITTLFWYNADTHYRFGEYRPSIHNSDGLLVYGDNNFYWMPFVNYVGTAAIDSYSSFDKLKYFAVIQRNRNFDSYLDPNNQYDINPNIWITPDNDWGPGNVRLSILPTDTEYTDNVNIMWVPKNAPQIGKPYKFNYTINCSILPPKEEVARVNGTWNGLFYAKEHPNQTYFLISFKGDKLNDLPDNKKIKAIVDVVSPGLLMSDPKVEKNKETDSWWVSFYVKSKTNKPIGKPILLKCYLTLDGKTISENWNYLWRPIISRTIAYL